VEFKHFFEIFGSFNYVVPKDKEQQLFDFYMLNNLTGRSALDSKRQKAFSAHGYDVGTKTFSPEGEHSDEDKIDYMLNEVKEALLPTLKDNLLDAVFFSAACEFRHIFDLNDVSTLINHLNKEELNLFKIYAKTFHGLNRGLEPLMRVPNVNQELLPQDLKNSKDKARRDSFVAAEKTGNRKDFMALMGKLFSFARFHGGYGGKSWTEIAKGWLDLYKATSFPQMFLQIDHIYDLQHNTGSVLNKVETYLKDSSYEWLQKALNLKAHIKSPFELVDKISPQMKKLAARAIKLKTGQSWEQYIAANPKKVPIFQGKFASEAPTPATKHSDAQWAGDKYLDVMKNTYGGPLFGAAIALSWFSAHDANKTFDEMIKVLKGLMLNSKEHEMVNLVISSKKSVLQQYNLDMKNAKILDDVFHQLQNFKLYEPENLTQQQCKSVVDLVASHGFVDPFPEDWHHFADSTNMNKIQKIKLMRDQYRKYGLKYAKELVEYYTIKAKLGFPAMSAKNLVPPGLSDFKV